MTPSITILAISTPLSLKTFSIKTLGLKVHNKISLHHDTQYDYTCHLNTKDNDSHDKGTKHDNTQHKSTQ
jgi:hypothetical protein